MKKILVVTIHDLAGHANKVSFSEIAIRDLSSVAINEASSSDKVIFQADNKTYILKDRT